MTEQSINEQILHYFKSIDSRLEAIEKGGTFRKDRKGDSFRGLRRDLDLEAVRNQRNEGIGGANSLT